MKHSRADWPLEQAGQIPSVAASATKLPFLGPLNFDELNDENLFVETF